MKKYHCPLFQNTSTPVEILNNFEYQFSVSTSECLDLFEVILLLISYNLVSKSVFVIKFACANLALKTLSAKVLNSRVVIYLS